MAEAAWEDLQLFFHVATAGGLTGAATRTGLSAPTIGRRILALERATGRTLFFRSQQGYRLAHDGEVLLAHVRTMRQAADQIAEWQSAAFSLPIVAIAADPWLAGFFADAVSRIRRPGDEFRLCMTAIRRPIDLTYRSATVSVLAERPDSGNLAFRRSVTMRYGAYASRALPVDDDRWVSIGTESAQTSADRWVFENREGKIHTWTTAQDLLLGLVRAGCGQGVMPLAIGDADPALRRVGEPIEALDHPLWIIVNDDDRSRPEIRLVIDRIAELLASEEARLAGSDGSSGATSKDAVWRARIEANGGT